MLLKNENADKTILDAKAYTMGGVHVFCPVCGGGTFHKRHSLLTGPFLTFIQLEWLSHNAVILTCDTCGHILWFENKEDSGATQFILLGVGILIILIPLFLRSH